MTIVELVVFILIGVVGITVLFVIAFAVLGNAFSKFKRSSDAETDRIRRQSKRDE